jgi:hypothetical protein
VQGIRVPEQNAQNLQHCGYFAELTEVFQHLPSLSKLNTA